MVQSRKVARIENFFTTKKGALIGLDTETYRGRAVLICTPETMYEPTCFDGIIQFLNGGRFCCWNMDYDVQAIVHFLSRESKRHLSFHTRLETESWKIRYVRRKFFKLWIGSKLLFEIYDLYQFYNCGLNRAAKKLLGETKHEIPHEWLTDMRSALRDPDRRQTVIDYCKRDALLCENIARLSTERFQKIGISFRKPVSCAALSMQVFGKAAEHKIPRSTNELFRKTFRGGRIECLKAGYFPRVYLYDLKSAYPSEMAKLRRCDGVFLPIKDSVRADAVYGAVVCSLRIPLEQHVGPVPISIGGHALIYPVGVFDTILDLTTFRVCQENDWITKISGGIQVIQCSTKQPFESLREMFLERQKDHEHDWAYKVIMNAVYGKLAEIIVRKVRTKVVDGHALRLEPGGGFYRRVEQWTKRTNFLYASAITAGIRARLFREIPTDNVIFYATDGVATTKPIRLPVGTRGSALGQWELKSTVRDLVVVGSGVYTYTRPDGEKVTHFRGFDCSINLYDLLDRKSAKIPLTMLRNVTLSQCERGQNPWKELNALLDTERVLDVQFDRKRVWCGRWAARDLLSKSFESKPWAYYGRGDNGKENL